MKLLVFFLFFFSLLAAKPGKTQVHNKQTQNGEKKTILQEKQQVLIKKQIQAIREREESKTRKL